jgi:hypothetical protein
MRPAGAGSSAASLLLSTPPLPPVPGLKLRVPLAAGYLITVLTHWGNAHGIGGSATDESIFAATLTPLTVRRRGRRIEGGEGGVWRCVCVCARAGACEGGRRGARGCAGALAQPRRRRAAPAHTHATHARRAAAHIALPPTTHTTHTRVLIPLTPRRFPSPSLPRRPPPGSPLALPRGAPALALGLLHLWLHLRLPGPRHVLRHGATRLRHKRHQRATRAHCRRVSARAWALRRCCCVARARELRVLRGGGVRCARLRRLGGGDGRRCRGVRALSGRR